MLTSSPSDLHTTANAIRILAVDAVAQAKSGHQGMPMGMAEIAIALWRTNTPNGSHLRHNPANPHWPNRDRFVLSNGHGSMLPYALLHLSGYDLPMSEIKNFRQLHSKTPGHPEVGERHAHRICEALTERPGRRLDAGRHANLGMPRCFAV